MNIKMTNIKYDMKNYLKKGSNVFLYSQSHLKIELVAQK